jgi:hypothetical protein
MTTRSASGCRRGRAGPGHLVEFRLIEPHGNLLRFGAVKEGDPWQ